VFDQFAALLFDTVKKTTRFGLFSNGFFELTGQVLTSSSTSSPDAATLVHIVVVVIVVIVPLSLLSLLFCSFFFSSQNSAVLTIFPITRQNVYAACSEAVPWRRLRLAVAD
jgi:hypothetical protein